MPEPKVEVKGIPELKRRFRKLEETSRDLHRPHDTIARALLSSVRRHTRRRSGRLVAAWGSGASEVAAHVTNPEPYAGPQESGWPAHGIEATLAIPQAAAEVEPLAVREYTDELERQIDRIGGSRR